MNAVKRNVRNLALVVPLLLAGLVFFSCHDSIFEDINKESSIGEDRIKGGATGFVSYHGCIYFAPTNDGVIYRKSNDPVSCHHRGDWDSIRCPEVPIFLAVEDDYLYMLTTTFANGSGDFEGVNMPTGFYEYRSKNPGDWGARIASYAYDIAGTNIPTRYKNQHTKVRAPAGGLYSIESNTNILYLNSMPILYADQKDVKVGSWWCLAGTSDQLILGTSVGLYHMTIGSTDINDDVAPNDISTAKSIFSGMTVLALYVAGTDRYSDGAWACSATNESNSVIYVFTTGPGSSYASQNGLYSYIPGQGWDSEF